MTKLGLKKDGEREGEGKGKERGKGGEREGGRVLIYRLGILYKVKSVTAKGLMESSLRLWVQIHLGGEFLWWILHTSWERRKLYARMGTYTVYTLLSNTLG